MACILKAVRLKKILIKNNCSLILSFYNPRNCIAEPHRSIVRPARAWV